MTTKQQYSNVTVYKAHDPARSCDYTDRKRIHCFWPVSTHISIHFMYLMKSRAALQSRLPAYSEDVNSMLSNLKKEHPLFLKKKPDNKSINDITKSPYSDFSKRSHILMLTQYGTYCNGNTMNDLIYNVVIADLSAFECSFRQLLNQPLMFDSAL